MSTSNTPSDTRQAGVMLKGAKFDDRRRRLSMGLKRLLEPTPPAQESLYKAMAYSVFGSVKCIRPLLTYCACEAMGGERQAADSAACAVELIHAYSLIHDDLPALDNDLLRRGKHTLHVVYGESTAIIAGDALQALAFEALSAPSNLSAETQLQMLRHLAIAAGPKGLAGGQHLDMTFVGTQPSIAQIGEMQRLKTGGLIEASVMLGALASGNLDRRKLSALQRFSLEIGKAFQVQDDILDVEGVEAVMGKSSGVDSARNKPTYVSELGLETARQYAKRLLLNAVYALDIFGSDADDLRKIASYIVKRNV